MMMISTLLWPLFITLHITSASNNNHEEFIHTGYSEQEEIIAENVPPYPPPYLIQNERKVNFLKQQQTTSNNKLNCQMGSGPKRYVSSQIGSNSNNDGTSSQTPYETIQHAVNNRPGPCSTIYVMDGIYRNFKYGQGIHHYNVIINLSGVNDGLIITNMPGNNKPKLEFDGPGGIVCQRTNPCSNIEISGLELEGPNADISYDQAINNRNQFSTINNRFMGRGIAIWKGHHLRFHHLIVHHCPGSAIRANRGDYVTIEDCRVYNNTWWSPRAESAIVFAESESVDDFNGIKMRMTRNEVFGNINKIPFYKPNLPWYESPIATGINCRSYHGCNPSSNSQQQQQQECPWQCRYGKKTQDYIIDGMGVYVTRNNHIYTHGRMELTDNISYQNGINGVVFHRTDRGIMSRNIIYDNGVVPRLNHPEDKIEDWHAGASGKSRQPYSGLVINNAEDVEMFDNKVEARYDDDYAFVQQFDSGKNVVPILDGGDNFVCKGLVRIQPMAFVAFTDDLSVCRDGGSAVTASTEAPSAIPTGIPTGIPSGNPSGSPTDALTANPTGNPTYNPTNTPNNTPSCTICSDDPTPHMIRTGKTCDSWPWGLQNRCSQNQRWTDKGYCRHSCFMINKGYFGDDCCNNLPILTASPTYTPTYTPTHMPAMGCVQCDDKPNGYMVQTGKTCDTWTWAHRNRCNRSYQWTLNQYCRYSCFMANAGYFGDYCCF